MASSSRMPRGSIDVLAARVREFEKDIADRDPVADARMLEEAKLKEIETLLKIAKLSKSALMLSNHARLPRLAKLAEKNFL